MKKILVDTSVIIDFLRCRDKNSSLFYRIFSQEKYKPVISLITITELWAGKSMTKKQTLRLVERLIKKCKIVFPSIETAKLTGKILRQTNYQISFQDAQIAALALENKLSLLTLNEKDFRQLKRLKLLSPTGSLPVGDGR